MHWKRWIGIAVVLIGVAFLIAYGYRPQPVMVDAGEVKRGLLRVTIEEEGKTRVTDRFVVSAPVAGYARRLNLEVGDAVKEGQVLLRLEPLRPQVLDARSRAEAEARVAATEAALREAQESVEAARADAAYWEGELARVKKLLATGDVPRERLDRSVNESRRSEATLKSAEQAIEVAASELKVAQAALAYSAATHANHPAELVSVRAPVSGRVLTIVRESEGVVQAGEPFVELGNARSLEVMVEVLSADAVRIAPGSRVLFERWGGDMPLEGRVREVEPTAFTKISALGVEEQRVRVIADIISPREQWTRLADGYRVEASFILWEGKDVLEIPSSALFRYQQGWAVFAIEGKVARRRVVEAGQRTGVLAQILSGLTAGEKVILHPDETVTDGTEVKVAGS